MNIIKWKYTISKNGRHQISEKDTGQQVCSLWNYPRRENNCKIIKDAPDMLEALLEIKKIYDDSGTYEEFESWLKCYVLPIITKYEKK